MPRIELSYQAASNISYNGSVIFDIDDDEWNDLDANERNDLFAEKFEEFLREDVGCTETLVDGAPFDE